MDCYPILIIYKRNSELQLDQSDISASVTDLSLSGISLIVNVLLCCPKFGSDYMLRVIHIAKIFCILEISMRELRLSSY